MLNESLLHKKPIKTRLRARFARALSLVMGRKAPAFQPILRVKGNAPNAEDTNVYMLFAKAEVVLVLHSLEHPCTSLYMLSARLNTLLYLCDGIQEASCGQTP